MKIAIQGQPASYHDQAARKFFGDDIKLVSCHNFRETFSTLQSDQADSMVIALENSLYGTINEVYDLLLKSKFWIVGEVYLRVKFCLVALPGANIKDIKEVHSHAVALGECEEFLDTTLSHVVRFEEDDTAGSAALVAKRGDIHVAAIASEEAAKLHGLVILAENVETHQENYTRFAVLAPKKVTTENANKTSLVLTTKADTKPGALFHALQVFADRSINITMLQSRPILGKAWHYLFYFDVEVGNENPIFNEIVHELNDAGWHTTILGSYIKTKA